MFSSAKQMSCMNQFQLGDFDTLVIVASRHWLLMHLNQYEQEFVLFPSLAITLEVALLQPIVAMLDAPKSTQLAWL